MKDRESGKERQIEMYREIYRGMQRDKVRDIKTDGGIT